MFIRGILFVSVLLISIGIDQCQAEVDVYKLGAIFDAKDQEQREASQRALEAAIEDIKNNYEFEFIPVTKTIDYDHPHQAMVETCALLEEGVIGIFGPISEDNSNVIQSICDLKEIPHIEVRWDDHPLNGTIVSVYPYPDVLTRTYLDIIEAWGWTDFVILYENNESLQRVGELLKLFTPSKHRIVVRQLSPAEGYLPVLKELRGSGATHFVLDCTIEVLEDVLRQAQQVGLMTSQQHYIITNLDLHTLDLEPYQHSETNITGMIFVDPDDPNLIRVAKKIHEEYDDLAGWRLRLEEALTYDAIMMFAEAIKVARPLKSLKNMNCDDGNEIFSSGTSIINFMRTLEYKGLTGRVKFDITGFRTNFGLDIIELKEGGVLPIGKWNSTGTPSLNISRASPQLNISLDDISNRTFTVMTTLTEPYGMEKVSTENLYGNDRYEGFAIDLIQELSIMRGFNYTIIIREDKKNGAWDNASQEWSGMLGDVIRNKADLAITDLTITSEREEGVDFTSPFMTLGISILYQKPTKAPPSFFSFADPFAFEVWRLLMVAWVGIAFIMFVLGRISPAEWENPYPCIEEPEYLVNQLDLRNCSWFVTGAILQQGSEIELKSISTRMVAGMWWFFTLLMVASYTANLAAFLTTETADSHFTNFKELVQNAETKKIKYGAKAGGATANFFRDKAKDQPNSEFGKAWEHMQRYEKEVMVSENKDGVDKADSERYAFFMESSSIEYETQRRCNLYMVGEMLDEKGYGIAIRKNETYRKSLSTAILQLQSSGKIDELKRKWWQERRGGGQCEGEAGDSEATPLDLKNVGGVFWVTICGTVLSCFLAIIEMIIHTAKKSRRAKIPFKTAIKEELKFYFKFGQMVKPVIYKHSSEENSSNKFTPVQSEEKSITRPYGLIIDKMPSVETIDSNSNSSKSRRSKKRHLNCNKEYSVNTC